MSIANSAASAFDDRTRNRGHEYFTNNEIDLHQTDPRSFVGVVKGPLGAHTAAIDAYEYEQGVLSTHCDCPQFKKGRFCKHLWATLLEIDSLYEVPLKRNLRLIAGNGAADAAEKQSNQWKSQIDAIAAESNRRVRDPGVVLRNKVRQTWFVIDVAETQAKGHLHLDFFYRESLVNGGWGKCRRMSYDRKSPPLFADSGDQELLDLLCGGQTGGGESTSHYRQWWGSQYSRNEVSYVELFPATLKAALPLLTETDRLVWQLDSSQPFEDAEPLAWCGSEPWRFRLVVEATEDDNGWIIGGELYRDDESVRVEEPVLLSADGFVLFGDRIGLLEVGAEFSWIVALRREEKIEVPRKAGEELAAMLLSSAANCEVRLPEEFGWKEEAVDPQPRLVIASQNTSKASRLYASLSFLYGDKPIALDDPQSSVVNPDKKVSHRRNRTKEQQLIANLRDLGLRPNTDRHKNEAHVWLQRKQLSQVVHNLTGLGWSVEAEGRKIRKAGSFSLSVSSNVDWFELDGGCDFEGQTVALPALLAAVRKGEKFVVLDDGTQGMLPEEWLEQYGALAELGKAKGDSLRFAHSQAALLDALLAAQDNVETDEQFLEIRDRLRSFSGIEPKHEIESFQGELREYQREGLGWLNFLQEYRFGGCLADDMGLGKTIQVLAMLEDRRVNGEEGRGPSLAVVPRSLVFNWIDEAAQFTPQLKVANYTGPGRETVLENMNDYDLLVTTYGTLRRDIVQLREKTFDFAILDEAQAIKNDKSQAAKACRLLPARRRLAMTGTPVENHLGELWSLFEFLNPGMLGRSSTFARLAKNGGDHEGLRVLASALRPFMLRRTKQQVLTELPEKTEQTLVCEMGSRQRKLYDELRDYYRASLTQEVQKQGFAKSKIHVLEALLRLRQAACHPGLVSEKNAGVPSAKLDMLADQIAEVVAEGHKALVFSQFTSFLRIVRARLDEMNVRYEYLDGRTRNRKEKVDAFQNDPECPLFLISLKAGGHGLNLTAADYVFILDPWWNPAVEAQAIDRAHRIGQTQRVFAYRLICRDTVEDKIIQLQQSKRDLADAIVASNNSVISDLTAEDLELLLS
ncbi:DEAD/DEAH box helicase [Lignipirellula cremea]|uniref:ATP-dependent helicase HepA n=1 Tax=Lignipirellula cremea TaxID=2528010 RepID=A0A518DV09_9BACT|nr:DEAD/DEAH box helicase [Lignipirellula cremea]QDU95682.1 ATP-dependent helicase HepA [Lignipirellula cremea]